MISVTVVLLSDLFNTSSELKELVKLEGTLLLLKLVVFSNGLLLLKLMVGVS